MFISSFLKVFYSVLVFPFFLSFNYSEKSLFLFLPITKEMGITFLKGRGTHRDCLKGKKTKKS